MRIKTLLLMVAVLASLAIAGCKGDGNSGMQKVEEQKAGDYQITVLAPDGQFKKGGNKIAIEVTKGGQPVAADDLQVSAAMPMQGMPTMVAPITTKPGGQTGRYEGTADFEMSGGWDMTVAVGGQKTQFKVRVK